MHAKKFDTYYSKKEAGASVWDSHQTVPVELIEHAILLIRGHKVLIDRDLAKLYQVTTKALNQAVKRNQSRFPHDRKCAAQAQLCKRVQAASMLKSILSTGMPRPAKGGIGGEHPFMFQLTREEFTELVTTCDRFSKLKHSSTLPYAFTEQGVAMLSGILNSPRAIQVNIAIMRAFVRLRQMLASHADLAKKLEALEQKYDSQFRVVFEAIRALMEEPEQPKPKIGFRAKEKRAAYAVK